MRRGVPLLAELLRAYGDEGLAAISYTAYNPELQAFVEKHGLQHSIALVSVAEKSIPYVDVERNGFTYVFVIGRNGRVRWRGDHVVKEKEFLKALWEVMNEDPVYPLDKTLAPALEPAVSLYCDGLFARAGSAALKIRNKHEKRSDAASGKIVEDADHLMQRIDEAAGHLLQRMEEARKNLQGIPFVKAYDALADGFAGTAAADRAEALEKEASKNKDFAKELKAARDWLSLLERYPILFPLENSSGTRSFANKLRKFIDKYEGLSSAEEAKQILDRFAS